MASDPLHRPLPRSGLRRLRQIPAGGLALALLTACSTPPPASQDTAAPPRFTSVSGGPTARLISRVKIEGSNFAAYAVNVLTGTEDCSGRQTLGAGRPGTTPPLPTVQIAAARLTTLEFVGVTADRKSSCMVRWSFLPTAGKSYLLQNGFDGQRCTSLVLDATDPDAIRPEPSALHRNPAPDKTCVPLSQARGLPIQASGSGDATLKPGASNDDLKGLIGR